MRPTELKHLRQEISNFCSDLNQNGDQSDNQEKPDDRHSKQAPVMRIKTNYGGGLATDCY